MLHRPAPRETAESPLCLGFLVCRQTTCMALLFVVLRFCGMNSSSRTTGGHVTTPAQEDALRAHFRRVLQAVHFRLVLQLSFLVHVQYKTRGPILSGSQKGIYPLSQTRLRGPDACSDPLPRPSGVPRLANPALHSGAVFSARPVSFCGNRAHGMTWKSPPPPINNPMRNRLRAQLQKLMILILNTLPS